MKLKLQNTWKYEDDDWWSWSAYLTGPDLEKVKFVQYILHPTFPDPVRRASSRKNNFRIDLDGWGTFTLRAIVFTVDGKEELLSHELILKKKPDRGDTGA